MDKNTGEKNMNTRRKIGIRRKSSKKRKNMWKDIACREKNKEKKHILRKGKERIGDNADMMK